MAGALLVALAALMVLRRSHGAEGIPLFADVASSVGLSVRVSHGGAAKDWIAEANGSGVAVLDFDADGWMDVLIVNGSTMPELRRSSADAPGRLHLFRNLGDGDFSDVTDGSGLANPYWGTGANAADYDNDGDVDILVTSIGIDLLFRNEGGARFVEVGAQAGLSRTRAWHTGSSFGDIDADGDLDLYVAAYLDLVQLRIDGEPPVCDYRGLSAFCGPQQMEPGTDILYRNDGDGTFTDITRLAGAEPPQAGYGFTPVLEDFTGDGHLDIFVANDSSPNFLFVNDGAGAFREDALAAGVALNADGHGQADMGVAVGDYDGDGDVDIVTTTFSEDYFPLFEQRSSGLYEDVAYRVGLRIPTVPLLGWGAGFADFDSDGDLDLWTANGHVYPSAGDLGTTKYRQSVGIFENRSGRFRSDPDAVSKESLQSFRGGASADFDNDGAVELILVPIDGNPVLLRSSGAEVNSWVGLRLVSDSGNVEAIGARVEVAFCGRRQTAWVRNGGSYASRVDPRPHFGLGSCLQTGRVTVHWPHGNRSEFEGIVPNRWVVLGPGI